MALALVWVGLVFKNIFFMTKLFNRTEVKRTRRKLRRNSTVTEDLLWIYLKNRQLVGQKFRRQYSIGKYVVDFYCPQQRLIVEVDGSIHQKPEVKKNDILRQEFLESLGLRVLRFSNSDVNCQIQTVLETIRNFLARSPLLTKERSG